MSAPHRATTTQASTIPSEETIERSNPFLAGSATFPTTHGLQRVAGASRVLARQPERAADTRRRVAGTVARPISGVRVVPRWMQWRNARLGQYVDAHDRVVCNRARGLRAARPIATTTIRLWSRLRTRRSVVVALVVVTLGVGAAAALLMRPEFEDHRRLLQPHVTAAARLRGALVESRRTTDRLRRERDQASTSLRERVGELAVARDRVRRWRSIARRQRHGQRAKARARRNTPRDAGRPLVIKQRHNGLPARAPRRSSRAVAGSVPSSARRLPAPAPPGAQEFLPSPTGPIP